MPPGTRHPAHPDKLVPASTAARADWPAVFDAFERISGPEARDLARDYWLTPTPKRRIAYREKCHPLCYTPPQRDAQVTARVACPTLVMAGDRDPITPIAFSETIVAHLPTTLTRFERFTDCGHGIVNDAPQRHFAVLRDFMLS